MSTGAGVLRVTPRAIHEVDLPIDFVPDYQRVFGHTSPRHDDVMDRKTFAELAKNYYGNGRYFADAAGCGFAFSYDPIRQKLLCIEEPENCEDIFAGTRSTEDELSNAFLSLRLKHGHLADDEDRQTITSFVAQYGTFIPFQSIQIGTSDGISVRIEDIKRAWTDARGWKWLQPGMPTSNPEWAKPTTDGSSVAGAFISAPYRQIRFVEGDCIPLLMTDGYKLPRYVSYFEAFSAWHETAVAVMNMSTNESDYTGKRKPQMEQDRRTLVNLWSSCISPDVTLNGGVARVEDRPRLRIYEPLVEGAMLYPCATVAFQLKDELDKKFEEDTRDLLIDRAVPCMTPGCKGVCHTGRSKIYGWAEAMGEKWAYCTDCQSGNGKKALRRIAKRHPEHTEIQLWWKETKENDKSRKTVPVGRV